MKNPLLLLLIILICCTKEDDSNSSSAIYIDDNGITIKSRNFALIGNTYELYEISYKIVDEELLISMVKNEDDLTKVVTSRVTDMSSLFIGRTTFNQDIGNWDTSNVTDMDYMFADSGLFNQDLTGWCVSNLKSEPNYFAVSSGLTNANKPVWGTCP